MTESTIIFDGYRAKPGTEDEQIRIVCTRVVIDKYQHNDTYIIHGMENDPEFEVADFLLEYCGVQINGIGPFTGQECSDTCPFYCGNCNAREGFRASPVKSVELDGLWVVQQVWEHMEVLPDEMQPKEPHHG